jgi:hypothetical protein
MLQWCQVQMPTLAPQVHARMTKIFLRSGFDPRFMVSDVRPIASAELDGTVYRLEFNPDVLPHRALSTDPEHRQALGAHCTTCEGCEGILRDRFLRGSEQLPMV